MSNTKKPNTTVINWHKKTSISLDTLILGLVSAKKFNLPYIENKEATNKFVLELGKNLGEKPTSKEVRDLVLFYLVGKSLSDRYHTLENKEEEELV